MSHFECHLNLKFSAAAAPKAPFGQSFQHKGVAILISRYEGPKKLALYPQNGVFFVILGLISPHRPYLPRKTKENAKWSLGAFPKSKNLI